jgi:hypothetical protein
MLVYELTPLFSTYIKRFYYVLDDEVSHTHTHTKHTHTHTHTKHTHTHTLNTHTS